ncbi:MAG: hypothetical protein ABIA75_06330 [Candidatus Neomarinimicrobiota bacterium]
MKNILLALVLAGAVNAADQPAVSTVGQPVLVLDTDQYFMCPKWSPIGTDLALTGPNYSSIYLYFFNANEVRMISDKPGTGFGMSWSHDGKSIAARVSKYENRRRWSSIAVYTLENSQEDLITDYVKLLPGELAWSDNDDMIYLKYSNPQIFSIPGKAPSLPRADETIYYVDDNKIVSQSLSGSDTNILISVNNTILEPVLSPDGQKIAYFVYGGNLWVTDLVKGTSIDLGKGEHPTWSADSRKLAYMITEDDGHVLTQSDIYVINIDGTGMINLTDSPEKYEMHPDWSPDGRWIAYDTNEDGKIWMQEVR